MGQVQHRRRSDLWSRMMEINRGYKPLLRTGQVQHRRRSDLWSRKMETNRGYKPLLRTGQVQHRRRSDLWSRSSTEKQAGGDPRSTRTMPSEELGQIFGRIRAGLRRSLNRGALMADPKMRELHDRLMGISPGKLTSQALDQTRYVVIDTETTGLKAYAPSRCWRCRGSNSPAESTTPW
jgi:hypothetical protein